MSDYSDSSGDPFSLLYRGVWSVLENHEGLIGLVAIPNRIKFTGNRPLPDKEDFTNTDLPELSVEPSTGESIVQTSVSNLLLRFDIVIKTDSHRLDNVGANGLGSAVYPVAWEVYRAMIGTAQTALKAIVWQGQEPFSLMRFVGMGFSRGDENKAKVVVGWQARMRYEIRVAFSTLASGPVPVGG